ncbi:transposase [Rhodococcus opacus]|nr:transposase [Rhodococcus opacus]
MLGATVTAIGLAVAGRTGARLATRLGIAVGRDTLLRAVRAIADPKIGEISILGIDDIAIRRGHVYGNVVVDLTRRRPIDLLADRTADTVAAWPRTIPARRWCGVPRPGRRLCRMVQKNTTSKPENPQFIPGILLFQLR